jgi:hypothetical protein
MKHLVCLTAVLMVSISTVVTRAETQETRGCEFKVKMPRVWGQASVTLADSKVTKLEVTIFYSSGELGRPGYTCTIDSSRTDDPESEWSEESGATVIANTTPFNANEPDRVKVTVGKYVSIDMEETQSLGRCGVGAALPMAIVISAKGEVCRVWQIQP